MAASNRTITNGVQMNNTVMFRSIGRTGTGSQETIAHGLGTTPTRVEIQLRDTSGGTNTYTLDATTPWDRTNIKVTVTTNAVYDLIAYV